MSKYNNKYKSQNIKIKRSKGRMYKKRRSPVKTVLETIVLVIIAGGLIYLGYTAAGPLIKYFSGEIGTSAITSWTPGESILTAENTNQTAVSGGTSANQPVVTDAPVKKDIGSYLLPLESADSMERLESELSKAEGMGFGTVIIPLKTTEGNILYSSNIEYIKDTDLISGKLTAKGIAQAIKKRGMTAKAVIPTLMDCKSPVYVGDTGYTIIGTQFSWLDASASHGGKQWIDPYLDGTKKYYSDIIKELKGAGFEEVVISQLRYPKFNVVDPKYLPQRNFEKERYKTLTTLYNNLYDASGKTLSVMVNIQDVLDGNGQDYGATAEILKDKSFSGQIILTVNLSDFGEELKTSGEPVKLPSDPAKKAAALIGKASEYISTNVTVIPVINGNGMSTADLEKCYKEIMAE